MDNKPRQKLIKLGAQRLAEALLELAVRSDAADNMIARLIATPAENNQRFKKKLASLKRSRRFIDWREVGHFADELEQLLDELQVCVTDPLTGIELVAAFFETDKGVFERCDDSNGQVGGVFYRAQEMFVDYGKQCNDKKKISAILLKLTKVDDYGIRTPLVNYALECGLPEAINRSMIAEFQKRAANTRDDYQKRHHLSLVESLARQLKDAELFEATRIASWGELSTAAYIDIAQVYLEQGDIETAQSRLKQIPENEKFMANERNKLWLEIYRQQGDTDKLSQLLEQCFRQYRTVYSLQALLDVVGDNRREAVISKEVSLIMKQATLNTADVEFLIAVGKIEEAETYLLSHADELNGNYYGSLLALAKTMEAEKRYLVVSLIYRALLASILERGYSKAYSHGVRYLKKLDKLVSFVDDWQRFDSHHDYKAQLIQTHGRKRSFWSKYQ